MQANDGALFRRACLAAAAAVGLGMLVPAPGVARGGEPDEVRAEAYRGITRVAEIMALARMRYVDPDEASFERMGEGAVRGLLSNLDEYAEFISAESLRAMGESVAGEFGGLGVWVGRRAGEWRVEGVLPTGPAWRGGVRAGDVLVTIDGEAIEAIDPAQVSPRLRGEPGTQIRLRILRPGADEPAELVLERAAIDLPSTVEAELRPDGIGWVRILHFNERTPEDLDEALTRLAAQDLRAIALDLRDNPRRPGAGGRPRRRPVPAAGSGRRAHRRPDRG
jgi:carboxyl-terminal processing protease